MEEEINWADFLHLIDSHRVQMYVKVLKYFYYRTLFSSEGAMVTGEEVEEVSAASERGGEEATAAPENGGAVATVDRENGDGDEIAASKIGDVAATAATENKGEIVTAGRVTIERVMAVHNKEADPDGVLDVATDEIMLIDTEPDITLLDNPEDQTK